MDLTHDYSSVRVAATLPESPQQQIESSPAWQEFKTSLDLKGQWTQPSPDKLTYEGKWSYPGRWSDYSADGFILGLEESELDSMDVDDVGYEVFEHYLQEHLAEVQKSLPFIKKILPWTQEEHIELTFQL
jgi:hypothetical protein